MQPRLTNEEVLADLQQRFAGHIAHPEEPYGMLTVDTTTESIIELLTYLRDHPRFAMNFLTDITAIHYPDRTGEELCIVYHCHSWPNNFRLRVKVYIPIAAPNIPTAIPVHLGADWMERETYDFFGVNFVGHPNLIRILNMEEMDYFPMRKEYTLEDPTRQDKVDSMFGR